jgi:hypothetical protein
MEKNTWHPGSPCTLHTCREEELSQPAKIVKKRALPPPPSNSLRSGAFWGSRRWGGQGARTGTLYGASSAPAQQLQGAPSLQSQASAASSADLEQEVTEEGAAAEEGAGGQGTEGEMNWLYGKWQCDPYIAKAEGGRVPKNDRGNVEVPPFAPALPVGCVHLIYPGLAAICRLVGRSRGFSSSCTGAAAGRFKCSPCRTTRSSTSNAKAWCVCCLCGILTGLLALTMPLLWRGLTVKVADLSPRSTVLSSARYAQVLTYHHARLAYLDLPVPVYKDDLPPRRGGSVPG